MVCFFLQRWWSFIPTKARENGFPDGKKDTKWREQHSNFKVQCPVSRVSEVCSADGMLLHRPRERDVWRLLQRQFPAQKNLVADLSQSISRTGARVDGRLPCITPGSVLAMAATGRVLTPLEKVMMHGFPVHRMVLPRDITFPDLASMGGNTMHVHIVGAAISMLLSLVDWSLPAVSAACDWDFGEECRVPCSGFSRKKASVSKARPAKLKPRTKKNKQIHVGKGQRKLQGTKGLRGPRSTVLHRQLKSSSQDSGIQALKGDVISMVSHGLIHRWALPKCKNKVIQLPKASRQAGKRLVLAGKKPIIKVSKTKIHSKHIHALAGTRWG